MSTSEYRSVDAEGDLPISAAELTALASQLFAQSIRPGPDGPPGLAPPAPAWLGTRHHLGGERGDGCAARRLHPGTAPGADARTCTCLRRPPRTGRHCPQTVPVAPRGNAPGSDRTDVGGSTAAGVLDPFAVPTSGLVPTIPGVLAGASGRGSPGPAAGAARLADRRAHHPDARRGHSPRCTARRRGELLLPDRAPVEQPHRPARAARRPRGLRRRHAARGLPDPARDRQRQAADLVRQRGHHPEAASGHRSAVVLLRARELQHPPRRARVGGQGHRRLRGRPGHGAALHRCLEERGDHLRPRHHRGDQPRRLRVGRQAPRAR